MTVYDSHLEFMVGERDGMSYYDLKELNRHYDCTGRDEQTLRSENEPPFIQFRGNMQELWHPLLERWLCRLHRQRVQVRLSFRVRRLRLLAARRQRSFQHSAFIGFHSQFLSAGCSSTTQLSHGETATISSPNYPQAYTDDTECFYLIEVSRTLVYVVKQC